MRLVQEIQKENAIIFKHQLVWCSQNSRLLSKKELEEDSIFGGSSSKPMYYVPPWDTSMVIQLENYEQKKRRIAELEIKGNAICERLDEIVSQKCAERNLKNV